MTTNNNDGPRSLLDIQAEQARDQRQPKQQSRGRGGGGGGGSRGGGGGGGGGNRGGNRNNNNRGSNNRPGGRGGRQQQQQQYDKLPLEQGSICTLKESFGFIHCADRPEEVFFHYSQSVGCPAGELQLNDEVEFRLGTSDKSDKPAAFQVKKLPPGTVQWETVEEGGKRFRGLVERATRFDRGNNIDGAIRMLVEKETSTNADEAGSTISVGANDADAAASNDGQSVTTGDITSDANKDDVAVDAATGPVVKFTNEEFSPVVEDSNNKNNNAFKRNNNIKTRLNKGDLVEFTLVTDRRTQTKYARNITLLLSERERLQQEEEQRRLSVATVEHGVVTALKGEYGFLRSNKRREEVYFHYSAVSMDEGDGGGQGLVLQEGQEMKFLVVDETPEHAPQQRTQFQRQQSIGDGSVGGGSERHNKMSRRLSARQVIVQPRGSVKFHDVIAHGVTGIVAQCPQPIDTGHALETKGKLYLEKPIEMKFSDGSPRTIKEVYLSSKHAPGGTFAFRGGSAVSCWLQVGDRLLFDVVSDYVDGACHAEPTKYRKPNPGDPYAVEIDEAGGAGQEYDPDLVDPNDQRVRLIEMSLVARAEGVVNAVRESYGFIHFSERPVDVHFKLFQMLPDELQNDIRHNKGIANVDSEGNPLRLCVGAECQFDISVHGTIHPGTSSARGRNQKKDHERENLKAQRVLLMPQGTIQQVVTLATEIKGTICKEDPKQMYAGMVDLDTAVSHMTPQQRHPLVAQMIEEYLNNDRETFPLVFHDIQTSKEDDVVIQMIELMGGNKLTWSHLPQAGESHFPGRLCIRKTTVEMTETYEGMEEADQEESATPSQDGCESASLSGDELESTSGDEISTDGKSGKRRKLPKKKTLKIVKTLRYDKASLLPEFRDQIPPVTGDVVVFDVTQSRRTGQVMIENMRVIERQQKEPRPNPTAAVSDDTAATSSVGIVKEIVAGRNFGFISVLDETASNREMLFFSLSNVVSTGTNGGATPRKNNKTTLLRKGDEVKFDIGTEKNGKRVALNVTVLPKGTIPSKAEKNACKGLVLLEPSYTSLKNTPERLSASKTAAGSEGGRWNVGDDSRKKATAAQTVVEEGSILLLEDPANMFAKKPKLKKKPSQDGSLDSAGVPAESTSENDVQSDNEEISAEADLDASDDGDQPSKQEESGNAESTVSAILTRLTYKNGALAIHGTGASTAADDSSNPKRGDLVSFVKSKNKGGGIRDIRIVKRGAATLVRGRLEEIQISSGITDSTPTTKNADAVQGRAKFVAASDDETTYEIFLSEVVSCKPAVLKEKESVEGILHDGKIYGVCRTCDLYLESKLGANLKERPKLNLTVKKDRGGTIMAQSMMAKGPDGTKGFAPGWTTRISKHSTFTVEPGEKRSITPTRNNRGKTPPRYNRSTTPPPPSGNPLVQGDSHVLPT